MLGYTLSHACALATCDAFPAMPIGKAQTLPLQTRRTTSPADNVAVWLMHYMSSQVCPWVIGESEYKGVMASKVDK